MIKPALFISLTAVLLQTAIAQKVVVKNPKQDFPPPQLGIAPPRVEQPLTLGKKVLDQSITLYNYNPKPKSIRLSFLDTNKQHRVIKPNDKTLSAWTIINPTEFTIEGNGQQTIRLSIRPPVGFPKKTHYAMLKIDQQVKDSLKFDEDGKGVTLGLGSSYGLPFIIKVN